MDISPLAILDSLKKSLRGYCESYTETCLRTGCMSAKSMYLSGKIDSTRLAISLISGAADAALNRRMA